MNPSQNTDDEKLQNTYNPLKVMQPGERVICEIKRHPFGLVGVYASLVLVIILAIAAVVLAPHLITGITEQTKSAIAFGGLILCAIVGLYTYMAVTIYKGNRWIVTSDSLTQISQVGLFRKQTSQLSLANLEDVTVEQNGLLQSMVGFGRLRTETAGERSKFVFDFCPKPTENAKKIIAAHEAYIAERPEEMHTTNQAVANAQSFNQSYTPPMPVPAPVIDSAEYQQFLAFQQAEAAKVVSQGVPETQAPATSLDPTWQPPAPQPASQDPTQQG